MSPSKPEVRAQKWYLGVRIWNVQITMAIEFTKGQVCGNQLCKWLSVLGKLYTQIGQVKVWPWEWKILLEISLRVAIRLLGRAADPGSKKKKKKCVSHRAQFFSPFLQSCFSEKNRRLIPYEQLILGILFLQISSWLASSLPLCRLTGPFLSRVVPGYCISHWPSTLTPTLPLPSPWSSSSHLPPNTLHTYFSTFYCPWGK